jgi:hypothetical protein
MSEKVSASVSMDKMSVKDAQGIDSLEISKKAWQGPNATTSQRR